MDLLWENVPVEEKGGKERVKQEVDVDGVPQL